MKKLIAVLALISVAILANANPVTYPKFHPNAKWWVYSRSYSSNGMFYTVRIVWTDGFSFQSRTFAY